MDSQASFIYIHIDAKYGLTNDRKMRTETIFPIVNDFSYCPFFQATYSIRANIKYNVKL